MKHNLITHKTELRKTEVLIGAQIYLSVEDAKGILAMTTMVNDAEKPMIETNETMFYKSRDLLRSFAKAVIYSGGEMTTDIDLREKFSLKNLAESSHSDHHTPDLS